MKKTILTLILFLTLHTFIQAEELQTMDYNLTTSENTQLHSKLTYKGWDFEGVDEKAVFIVIFGHRCPPCLAEMPSLIKAVQEHGDKLSIVAIEAQGLDLEELQKFKEEKGVNYTLLSRKNKENEYFFSDVAAKLNWKGQLPFLIAIDKHGEVKESKLGMISHEKIESLIYTLNQ